VGCNQAWQINGTLTTAGILPPPLRRTQHTHKIYAPETNVFMSGGGIRGTGIYACSYRTPADAWPDLPVTTPRGDKLDIVQ